MVNSVDRIPLSCLVTHGMELKSTDSFQYRFGHSFTKGKELKSIPPKFWKFQKYPHLRTNSKITSVGSRSDSHSSGSCSSIDLFFFFFYDGSIPLFSHLLLHDQLLRFQKTIFEFHNRSSSIDFVIETIYTCNLLFDSRWWWNHIGQLKPAMGKKEEKESSRHHGLGIRSNNGEDEEERG